MSVFDKNRCYAFQGTTLLCNTFGNATWALSWDPNVFVFLPFTLYDHRVF